MPDQKISQLASGTNAQTGDLFVIARSGANYSLTTAQLFNAPSATATLAALTVDTDTLFVDATNNRVSVGATALSASNNYGVPQLGTTADVYSTFHVESHHDTAGNYSFIGLMRSRGTRTAPTHLQSGDPIGIVTAQVYNDAGSFPYREAASIQFIAAGNHAAGSLPASISFRTTPSGSNSPLERMRLDSAGNLGLGVTPSAFATVNAVQVRHGSLFATTSAAHVGSNVFFDGSYKYIGSDWASRYQQFQGVHSWHTAPSGTAGNAISFTQAMTLDASGNLIVGNTTANFGAAGRGVIEINGSSQALLGFNTVGSARGYVAHTGTDMSVWNSASGSITFASANVSRWQINSSGHLLAGADATYDIGASGATRPRDVFIARDLNVDGGTLYVDATNNRVGIGTASPGAGSRLDIRLASDETSWIYHANSSTGASGAVGINLFTNSGGGDLRVVANNSNNTSGPGASGCRIFNAANAVLQLGTNNTERLIVKAEGSVRFVPLAAAPTTNVEDGDVYYDSGTNKLRVRAGGAWTDLH